MRYTVLVLAIAAGTSAYLASPFVAAWSIHDAVRTGDVAALETRLDWPRVRESLKVSLRTEVETAQMMEAEARGLGRPTLWQRIKLKIGSGMIDRFVDTTFTPHGLVQAYAARNVSPSRTDGARTATTAPGLEALPDVMAFLRRITRYEFHTFDRATVEVADVDVPTRRYVGVLSLEKLRWRVVSLSVRTARVEPPAPPAASPLVATVR